MGKWCKYNQFILGSPTKRVDESCILRCPGDFLARADAVDLITYVYVRSASVAEQHFALQGRKRRSFEVTIGEAIADRYDVFRFDAFES